MRYMGDAATTPAVFSLPGFTALTPADKATLVDGGSKLTDDQAETLELVVDSSSYGSRQKIMRIGIGAAVGLVVGAVAMKLIGG